MIPYQEKNDNSVLPERSCTVKLMCQDIYENAQTTILELKKVLHHLTSTILVICPAKLHYWFLQQKKIQALKKNSSYQSVILLDKESCMKLLWWVKNIEIFNSTLIQPPASSFKNRYFCDRLVSSVERNCNWRDMVWDA